MKKGIKLFFKYMYEDATVVGGASHYSPRSEQVVVTRKIMDRLFPHPIFTNLSGGMARTPWNVYMIPYEVARKQLEEA